MEIHIELTHGRVIRSRLKAIHEVWMVDRAEMVELRMKIRERVE